MPAPMSLRIRRRTRLRRKDAAGLLGRLAAEFGLEVPPDDAAVDEADAGDMRLLLLGSEPFAFLAGDAVAPTVRYLLSHAATRRHVTVDMGAVPHVYNGADVMTPGIVDADPAIGPGDIVWIRDERFGRPLAVGRALLDGPTMVRERKGKAVETLHHVGDDLWSLAEEAP